MSQPHISTRTSGIAERPMAELLHEIEWSTPILPGVADPEWESRVKAHMGFVPDVLVRTSRSTWLRNALFDWLCYEARECPRHLSDICALVTAQENACRYCYGVARSQMRLFGYSEEMIGEIERGRHLAELDEKERAFVRLCRNLSRSSPRPPKSDCAALMNLGYSEVAVAEMVFLIGSNCFINRVSTFLACPPVVPLERLSTSLLGRLFRPLIARKMRGIRPLPSGPLVGELDSFPGVVRALQGLPAARALNDALQGCFESDTLSDELKVLMFAVVARSLECSFCQDETRTMAEVLGLGAEEYDAALQSLASPRLSPDEAKLLAWTRESIRFRTGPMQQRVAELADELDEEILLEAIGVAALANTTVRLAILLA